MSVSESVRASAYSWAILQPSVIHIEYIPLLVGLVLGIFWLSSFRGPRRCNAAVEKSRYQSDDCPFTIRQLNKTTHLIRENDRFGEYPHIYVKKCTQIREDGEKVSVFVLNDTGCGTSTPTRTTKSREWNIRSFIEHHLNPNGDDIPFLVILSHCHYDHILGLEPLLQTEAQKQSSQLQIMSSSRGRSFLEPRKNLEKHSLCKSMGLPCPRYNTTMWADDAQKTVEFLHDKHLMRLPIMTLQTPGHTPDSLSWWDDDERVLYVGDMLYEQESADSRAAPWEREDPAPILFPNEGDLSLWWWNLNRLIKFVEARNKEGLDRVKLSAGHVTANVDALACLMAAKDFMTRILRDEVDFREQPIKRGERFGHWSDRTSAFSLGAPLRVIEEGRLKIPQKEWMAFNKHIKTEVWSAI